MNYYYINNNLELIDKPIYDNTCLRCKSIDIYFYCDKYINRYYEDKRVCNNCKFVFKPTIKGYYKDFKNPGFNGLFEPGEFEVAKINEALKHNPNAKTIYFK